MLERSTLKPERRSFRCENSRLTVPWDMVRVPVESSAVASIGYDDSAHLLEVEFRSGRVYEYYDVPAEAHAALLSAESIGLFLNTEIKGRYRYARIS